MKVKSYINITRRAAVALFAAGMLLMNGCGVYSFTGASIPVEAKTLSVGYFRNRAASVQPTLSSVFTDYLREYLSNQSGLPVVEGFADLQFSGAITGYTVTPQSIQGNDQAALNRLTITVQVKYVNRFDSKFNFSQNFSRYRDYDARLSLSSVESSLIQEITEELVDDIYQKAFVNW